MLKPTQPTLPGYALFAATLALCGLPLYIHLPAFLASHYGITLQSLGLLLVILRLFDFIQDPLIGWFLSRHGKRVGLIVGLAGLVLGSGMVGLFAIPAPISPVVWITICLALAFTGFSLLSILIYADGVERGTHAGHVRVATWREAGSLIGITTACLLPFVLPGDGYLGFALFVAFALLVAIVTMRGQWLPFEFAMPSLRGLFADRTVRHFLALAFFNAMPVAITSTLFVFFVDYRLVLPGQAGLFLVLFFISAAASTPLWQALATRFGARRILAVGMVLAIASFIWAFTLNAGDQWAFGLVCITSGAALGADMMLLPALFSRYQAHASVNPALAFGFWNFAGKASLALAAGLVLPLLSWAGFEVDAPKTEEALTTLAFLYAIVPCILKLLALSMLFWVVRPDHPSQDKADPVPVLPTHAGE